MPDNPYRAAAGLMALLALTFGVRAAPKAAPADLRRGLIATHKNGAAELTRLEPTVALSLKAGEAAHPRLSADGGTVRWQGYVNVTRADEYRFRVRLRGNFRLKVGGKEVLSAKVKDNEPVLKEGPALRLEAGVHPFEAEFTRLPGGARVELTWQAKHFRAEPLPYDVLGHLPAQLPARFEGDRLAEHGRYLAEEHSCIRCHRPGENKVAKGLQWRQGPDLSKVGQRVKANWLYRWLESPRKLRPGATMPEMFAADEKGAVERYAVVHYLSSLGGPFVEKEKRPAAREIQNRVNRGRELFVSTGCVACHGPVEGAKPEAATSGDKKPWTYPLRGMGGKTSPEQLAAYLRDPLAISPGGRMPHMLLNDREARDLAYYLWDARGKDKKADLPPAPPRAKLLAAFGRLKPDADELAAFQKLPEGKQWHDLGKRLVVAKRCAACHTIAPRGKPLALTPARSALDKLKDKPASGCLADEDKQRGGAPRFAFDQRDRKAIRTFLSKGLNGPNSPAPAYAAKVTLKRFNCLACHSRDGEGGLSPALVEELRRYEKAENAEAVSPPPLTGVGHKLRTSWLRDVLTRAGRARPWMGLRMPQFGKANVGHLPGWLAALEGAVPDDGVHVVKLSGEKIAAGRHLVGKNAFGCISCHDIAGVPNHGTRGPDMATTNQRVRYDWYLRWLESPQRMQPGTRMPTVFPDGKSPLPTVLGGDAEAQAEAMWAYLSLGPTLPLPEGLEPPGGMTVAVAERPVILRTFLPDAGTRAVAVGYPRGVSVAFDAATCRLAYAWSGNFLDASPVWGGRGGNPAKLLGPRFWTAPDGCPWGLGEEPPDFAARAKKPGFGGKLPEGQYHNGPRPLRFEGYSTDKEGEPAFRYRIGLDDKQTLRVTERAEPRRSPVAYGVTRRFTLEVPAKQTAWMLAGETDGRPRLLNGKGNSLPLDLKGDKAEIAAAGQTVLLPQSGDRVVVLQLIDGPEGSRWRLRKSGQRWQAILRLPPSSGTGAVEVSLRVWAPYRDEPGLLKELLSAR